jgi:hypothetical protein
MKERVLSDKDESTNEEGDGRNCGATAFVTLKLGNREGEPKPRDEDETVPGSIRRESQIQRNESDLPRTPSIGHGRLIPA